jgi:hypothetical protein
MKKNDLILILIVAAIAAGALIWMQSAKDPEADRWVVIESYGELLEVIPLTESTEQEIRIGDDAVYNLVIISQGVVNMIESDCPDQICVETKSASEVGDMIVCLPHQVIIYITDQPIEE